MRTTYGRALIEHRGSMNLNRKARPSSRCRSALLVCLNICESGCGARQAGVTMALSAIAAAADSTLHRPNHGQSAMKTLELDVYVLDTLMPDLVGHDRAPSAF